jgi:Ser/Thr protein kinase RdoA (MazF antagonist)
MPTTPAAPYAQLTPDVVLDALESAGWRGDGRVIALNSYENRVYLAQLEDGGSVVAKFYRPARWSDAQILEEHAFVHELREDEVPAVAPLPHAGRTLLAHAGYRFAVYPRRGGRAPELDGRDAREKREWLGRYIARIHNTGARRPFAHRPQLAVADFGIASRQFLLDGGFIPAELCEAWRSTADDALAAVQRAFDAAQPLARLRLHGDCHLGNVLWVDGQGPHFVDFDDARSGPAVQDLWMLLDGDRAAMTQQLGELLDGYEELREFDRRELALIEPLRTLRILHHSAWIARRWHDPAFPAAFPWFGSVRYWQEHILALREQLAAMQEEPLAV